MRVVSHTSAEHRLPLRLGLLLEAAVITALFFSVIAACAGINDHDLRLLCQAEATHDASYCAAIRDHDLRQLCIARVSGLGRGDPPRLRRK